jgi:hypothetical protein
MATPAPFKYHIERFWDDEFKTIDYIQEPFNDPDTVDRWISQGYQDKICGDLADMRHELPSWCGKFFEIYQQWGWKDIGLAFYRMSTGTVMPVHQDLYKRYIELFEKISGTSFVKADNTSIEARIQKNVEAYLNTIS